MDTYLAGHLELEVLSDLPLSGRVVPEGEQALGVVRLDEILDDGAGFPDGLLRVGVLDGWHAAVGVDGCEPFFLGVVDHDLLQSVLSYLRA